MASFASFLPCLRAGKFAISMHVICYHSKRAGDIWRGRVEDHEGAVWPLTSRLIEV